MAEGGSVYQDTVVCRYFLSGTCYEGESCPFSHDATRCAPDSVCRYFLRGNCFFGSSCKYEHPFIEEMSRSHIEKCKREEEFSIAIERSLDKTCGICMDVVLQKEPESERRFGLLEKCNHVYCFSCIRQWWNSMPYDNDDTLDPAVIRACPQCRVVSDFVTPSLYFLDTGEEKQKFIKEYKEALSNMPCKYFKQGDSICPFGGACFYLHAKPDGTKVELPLPFGGSGQNGELDSTERITLEFAGEIPQQSINLFSDTDDDLSYTSDSSYFNDYSETMQNQNGDAYAVERMHPAYRYHLSELIANLISETDDDSSD